MKDINYSTSLSPIFVLPVQEKHLLPVLKSLSTFKAFHFPKCNSFSLKWISLLLRSTELRHLSPPTPLIPPWWFHTNIHNYTPFLTLSLVKVYWNALFLEENTVESCLRSDYTNPVTIIFSSCNGLQKKNAHTRTHRLPELSTQFIILICILNPFAIPVLLSQCQNESKDLINN